MAGSSHSATYFLLPNAQFAVTKQFYGGGSCLVTGCSTQSRCWVTAVGGTPDNRSGLSSGDRCQSGGKWDACQVIYHQLAGELWPIRRPFQNGGELLLFSTVEVTPVLEWSPIRGAASVAFCGTPDDSRRKFKKRL